MNNKLKFTSKKELLIHLLFWLLYAYFYFINFNESGELYIDFSLFSITWIVVFISTFYFNYFIVLPKVANNFNLKKAILALIVVFTFFIFLRYATEQIVTNFLFNKTNYFPNTHLLYYAFDNFYFGSKPIIISSVFWIVISFIHLSEYNSYIIEEQKNTEIKFLKAQINPHFVFNTLNNIYSMVYFKSDKSLNAIEKLGNIMRFTTYESQKDFININEEIDYIHSYIELDLLRHTQQNFVTFEVICQAKKPVLISPYILSPLVENALKHGIISDEKIIEIKLFFDDEKLNFEVINFVSNHKKDDIGGIGIDNLKKRLDIHYPQKNNFNYSETNGVFTANLQIYF